MNTNFVFVLIFQGLLRINKLDAGYNDYATFELC